MKVNKYNELNKYEPNTNIKSVDICSMCYQVLDLLIHGEYLKLYNIIYDSKDMLYIMFKDDIDVENFLEMIKKSVDSKNFYGIYDPINNILNKLISSNFKK